MNKISKKDLIHDFVLPKPQHLLCFPRLLSSCTSHLTARLRPTFTQSEYSDLGVEASDKLSVGEQTGEKGSLLW